MHEDELYYEHAQEDNHEHAQEHIHGHAQEHSHGHAQEHSHTHTQEHDHGHAHGNHTHTHSAQHTKAVINRLNRAIGHMEAVRNMIEEGRDCSEVLIQIAAVRSAINNIGKLILKEHISHCVVDAVETGDEQCLKDLEDAINKFVK